MTKMLKAAAAAGLFTAFAGQAVAAPPAAGGETVVLVDVSRVFSECNACKTANTQLQQQGQQLQTYAEQLSTPLRTEATSIQTAIRALNGKQPDAALQARETAFGTKQDQARQDIQQREAVIQRNQNYARQQIGAKLGPIVTTVMNAHHAQVAIDAGATLASTPSIDVTAEVLTQLNAQLPSVSVTAPAAPAAAAGADGR